MFAPITWPGQGDDMSDPKRVLSRLGSLEDEIERLRAINAELVKQSNEYVVMNARLSERNAELLAALEAVVPFTGTTGPLSAMAYARALAVIAKTKGETP